MRVLLASLALASCAVNPVGPPQLDRVPTGEWGGKGVRLTVQDSGAEVEFDCAHGSLDEPLALDREGRFDVKGTFVTEGGPARIEDAAHARPARYLGQTDGKRMSLEVVLDGGESGETFQLEKDGRAKLFKCL